MGLCEELIDFSLILTYSVRIKITSGEVLEGIAGTLKDWEEHGFIQIHKSTLVNLDHLRGIQPRPGEDSVYKGCFKHCLDELTIGSTYLDNLRQALAVSMINRESFYGYFYIGQVIG